MHKLTLILGAIFMSHSFGSPTQVNTYLVMPKSGADLIAGFSPAQISLWNKYVTSQKISDPTLSQITTFAGVTHALEHTVLTQGQDALSLVDEVTDVEGEVPAAASYKQFNLAVVWKEHAIKAFQNSGFTYRVGFGHSGESGLSYHSSSYGIHILYQRVNHIQGHVHVDYRYFSLAAHGEGHFHPYNSDVRAVGPEMDYSGRPIDNYLRHNQWYGPIPNYRY